MNFKILVVEDDEMNRDMLSRRLALEDYQVILAVDGPDGIAHAQAEAPDLILMDMSLPVLNGWEATKKIRQTEKGKTAKIIALTAHAMEGSREASLASGMDDQITKPLTMAALTSKLLEWLSPAET